jgi:uncharacterized protein (DUF924 family)
MDSQRELIEFWFSERVRPMWFRATPEFDLEVRERYESLWRRAQEGGLDDWRQSLEGALALVILLDQLPLNMFRGEAQSFCTEAASRQVAEQAIEQGFDKAMPKEWRMFLYMPYMHSEHIADQDRSVDLYAKAGLDDNLHWAKHHRAIVQRFGRFPHRNAILGRDSSEEERQWLASSEAFKG